MKRTKKQKCGEPADLILCGDIHIRQDAPVCRVDDFMTAQWNKLRFIKDLQEQHNCPVICSGDLFHHWKPSPELLSETIRNLPEEFYTIYGNHDLPQHNMDMAVKSGIHTLDTAGVLTVLPDTHWGQTPPKTPNEFRGIKMLVWHVFNYVGKEPWPGCTESTAERLLKKYKQFDLIVTGDNHKPFVIEDKGRILVNPGSMMRQSADQIDFRPRVYLYYKKTNTVEPIYLPIDPEAVTRIHLEKKESRNERIEAFVESLDGDWSVGTGFEGNLNEFFMKNRVRKSVKEIAYKAINK